MLEVLSFMHTKFKHFKTYSGFVAIICVIFFLSGCVKQTQVPESEMEVIKDFQRIVVFGAAHPWTKTKINIKKGDQILIIAEGSVNVWPGRLPDFAPYENLVMKIGENGHTKLAVGLSNQMFFRSGGEGRLMFCARDWDYLDSKGRPVMEKYCGNSFNCNYYDGNSGQYQIDVFVFSDSTEDEIIRTLEKISEANPNDKKLRSAISFTLQNTSFTSRSYDEEVSKWTSYRDVQIWLGKFFSYDMEKAQKAKLTPGKPLPVPVKSPREVYDEKTGICFDAAYFTKETLNRIDPSYEAEVVHIENRPYYKPNHVVCSFKMDGQLYIMDYGVPRKTLRRGLFGPFNSLEEYKEFFIQKHPKITRVNSISFGWPDYLKDNVLK